MLFRKFAVIAAVGIVFFLWRALFWFPVDDVEQSKVHLWADPFENAQGRPQEQEFPTHTDDVVAVVGPCEVSLPAPSEKHLRLTGLVSMEPLREALDVKLLRCLQRSDVVVTQDMLFQAVVPGFTQTCTWLTEQGAKPKEPLQRLRPRQLEQRKSLFASAPAVRHALPDCADEKGSCVTSGARFFFNARAWRSTTPGKTAIQLALQGGYMQLVRQWSSSGGFVDSSNHTVPEYISAKGAASSSAGLDSKGEARKRLRAAAGTAEARGLEAGASTEQDAAAKVYCDGKEVPAQWLGWQSNTSFDTVGRCDLEVIEGDMTHEQYVADFWRTGRPFIVRGFMPQEDQCLMEKERIMRKYGNKRFSMGATAYPEMHGGRRCRDPHELSEVERSEPCRIHPDISPYYAQVVQIDAEPCKLVKTLTFRKIARLLNITEQDLDIVQLFMGGDRSGAQMHFHSAAFNLIYVGQKDWFLLPPSRTALTGMSSYDLWHRKGVRAEHVLRCTQNAGDLMVLPDAWGHATLSHGFSAGLGVLYGMGNSPLHKGGKPRSGFEKSTPMRNRHKRTRTVYEGF